MTALEYSDDYLYWDNVEPVKLTVKSIIGGLPIDISVASRGSVDRRASFYNGIQLQGDETLWKLPAVLVEAANVVVNPQDVITTESGERHIVVTCLKVQAGRECVRWECLTRLARGR